MGTRTVQFTGERTGKAEILVPGYGLIHAGDILEVPEGVAAAWTTLHPTGEGGPKADFTDLTDVPLQEPEAVSEEPDPVDDPADNDSPAESGDEGETE
jgi:hypothetical protein